MDELVADSSDTSIGMIFVAPPENGRDTRGCPAQRSVQRQAGFAEIVSAPPVFVVGSPRSGTTLVQTMLDSHPRLSVTYEADFLIDIPLGLRSSVTNASEALTLAAAHLTYQRHSFDVRTASAACRELGVTDAAGAMRVMAASRALAQGKVRWGNKTPKALLHLAELAIVYPDAQFIHVIRDGRESASSQARGSDRGKKRSVVEAALLWRTGIRAGRRAGSVLGPDRYLEVRLEELLSSPEEQLRRMCAFLGEDFDQSLLGFHTTARERIPESSLASHPRLGEPPRPLPPSREAAATGLARRAADALIGAELVELGYVPAASSRRRWRTVYVVIGYAYFLVSLRRSLPDLLRHFARSAGARRATRQ